MLTKLRNFIVKNKLYVSILSIAVVLCLVVGILFGVLGGQTSLPVSENSVNSFSTVSDELNSGEATASSEDSTSIPLSSNDGQTNTTSKASNTTQSTANQAVIGSTIYSADTSTKGYNSYSIVGVDNLGRTFNSISSEKSDKKVGIFFNAAVETETVYGIYDCSKILAMPNGLKLLTDPDYLDSDISPVWQVHFWSEPLWGYYRQSDEWVIRKQLEMLSVADIDFIVFDVSNSMPDAHINFSDESNVYTRIMKAVSQLTEEGWDVPKVAFYTHSYSIKTINTLYNNLYKRNIYKKSWYMVNGKPFIIGFSNLADDLEESASRGETQYKPTALSNEVINFFSWRTAQWPQETYDADGFPWMEWTYPAPVHNGVINVTTAAHPMVPMSFSLTRANWTNWGRGWNVTTKKNVSADVAKGSFYQSTWNTALEKNPDTVFIGEWNEWVSSKQMYDGEYMLCDEVNEEYSRDIEPMVGGFEDNFYMQTIQNIRKYKGNSGTAAGQNKTINIRSSASQWNSVTNVYRSIGATALARNSFGVSDVVTYKQDAPRNNLQEVKMVNDGTNVYINIRSDKAISTYDGKSANWMNVYIGTGDVSSKGWEGYEYVINRSPTSTGKTSVDKLDANGKSTSIGAAEYTVDGNVMQIKIPLSVLGNNAKKSIYFKVADNVSAPTDIMSYYTTGKSLPLGRLSYQYNMA